MNRINRVRAPVKRQSAERYLLITLLSFAASVSLTRLFLQLTGYPKLGSGGLHIAHVLWGGLLLFVAALLPLIFANRWAYTWGALLAGIGVGLFIDEVGKFITQNNDYFYPPAAPIIYAFFLVTALVYLQVRRPPSHDARTELYHALDEIQEVLDRDLDVLERDELETRLRNIAAQPEYPDLARLATELLEFLHSRGLHVLPDRPTLLERTQGALEAWMSRHIDRARLRLAIIVGLGLTGIIAMGKLIGLMASSLGPATLQQALDEMAAASSITNHTPLSWFIARLVLEGSIGLALLIGCVFLMVRQERRGLLIGYCALLLSLTAVDLLLFYFDQFSTILVAILQVVVLVAILYYRRMSRKSDSPSQSVL
jgi:hypothetical protein